MQSLSQAVALSWSVPPAASFALALTALVYLRGWLLLRRAGLPFLPPWRATSFLLGLLALWIALASPLDTFSGFVLTAHMVQHMTLMMVAPPLILLGAPSPVKSIADGLSTRAKLALSHNPHGGVAAMFADCISCAADYLMAEAGGPATDRDGFERLCAAVRSRLHEVTADVVRRVESALAGDLELRELSVEEGVVFNAEIAAAVQEKLAESNYWKLLAERGITTVALNEEGEIVEHRPDGTSVVLTVKRRPPRRRKVNATPTR